MEPVMQDPGPLCPEAGEGCLPAPMALLPHVAQLCMETLLGLLGLLRCGRQQGRRGGSRELHTALVQFIQKAQPRMGPRAQGESFCGGLTDQPLKPV